MRFSALMRVVEGRGVRVEEVRAGGDPEIGGVCEDSRKVKAGDLFVARRGTKASGLEFVEAAVRGGAVAVIVDGAAEIAIRGLGEVAVGVVGNANLALAILAHEVAENPTRGMKMIGVTGTKGKTTVAYLMRSVLKAGGGAVVGMVGTVEIDDGKAVVGAEMTTPGVVELVGLFSRMRANGVTHCVMEVSSHALHQDRVAGIDWAVGIFTNLTGDHLDYHGTMEAYGAAKRRLFEGLKEGAVAVVNVDDAWGERMVGGAHARVVRVGMSDGAGKEGGFSIDWLGKIEAMTSAEMEMTIGGGRTIEVLETPLVGRHNAYNLLCVVAAASALKIPPERSVAMLADARGAPGRLQRVGAGDAGFEVFVDYAHTHDSLENVLKALRATMGTGKLICVFGCGGDRDRTKRPKMGRIAQQLSDQVVVTSDNPRTEDAGRIIEEVCAGFEGAWRESSQIVVEPDRRAGIGQAIAMATSGDVVLIAGKGHENYQIIGTTKHHFDDVEEAAAAMGQRNSNTKDTKSAKAH